MCAVLVCVCVSVYVMMFAEGLATLGEWPDKTEIRIAFAFAYAFVPRFPLAHKKVECFVLLFAQQPIVFAFW